MMYIQVLLSLELQNNEFVRDDSYDQTFLDLGCNAQFRLKKKALIHIIYCALRVPKPNVKRYARALFVGPRRRLKDA